jgi:hypothetical protein
MKKIWKRFFQKSGRVSAEITIHAEYGYFGLRSMELDSNQDKRLQIDAHPDSGSDETFYLNASDAKRLGDVLLGYAAAFKDYDHGRNAGFVEWMMKEKKDKEMS